MRRLWAAAVLVCVLFLAGRAFGGGPQRLIDVARWQERFIQDKSTRAPSACARVREFPAGQVLSEPVVTPEGMAPVSFVKEVLNRPGCAQVDVDLEGATRLPRKIMRAADRGGGRLTRAEIAEPIRVPAVHSPPSVILISIDTLRADHVGVYGYDRARTPVLDRLARGSVWYADAYSASTWTVPSHRALLSGHFPGPSDVPPQSTEEAPFWLAERFRKAGYITVGYTGGGYVSGAWGFSTGFDTYYAFIAPHPILELPPKSCPPDRFDGPVVFRRAQSFVRTNSTRPFFLFVHTYDVHDRCLVWPKNVGNFTLWPHPGQTGRQAVIDSYDDLIAGVDEMVGALLAEIDKADLATRTIIVVTSDHGEALWEHGLFGHGCALKPYESTVRVPLIIHAPGDPSPQGRIDQPVSAVDVAPTLLALAGLPPPRDLDGELLPGLGLAARAPTSPVFVSCGDRLAVRLGSLKLVSPGATSGPDELYDLDKDPGEKTNLLPAAAGQAMPLRTHAREYRRKAAGSTGAPGAVPEGVDDATRERLRSLGYIP